MQQLLKRSEYYMEINTKITSNIFENLEFHAQWITKSYVQPQ